MANQEDMYSVARYKGFQVLGADGSNQLRTLEERRGYLEYITSLFGNGIEISKVVRDGQRLNVALFTFFPPTDSYISYYDDGEIILTNYGLNFQEQLRHFKTFSNALGYLRKSDERQKNGVEKLRDELIEEYDLNEQWSRDLNLDFKKFWGYMRYESILVAYNEVPANEALVKSAKHFGVEKIIPIFQGRGPYKRKHGNQT